MIKCDENIVRKIYWYSEKCQYVWGDTIYKIIFVLGIIIFMVGVICFGNVILSFQIAFAAFYMIFNTVYWVVAAFSPQWDWDLLC